jgi:predicted GIY-YIG superfamily endonuclease
MPVYLLHFSRRISHAGHYLGYADDLDSRLERHHAGNGARLVQVAAERGIGFILARTWKGDKALERRLKRQKASPRLCPICRAQRSYL